MKIVPWLIILLSGCNLAKKNEYEYIDHFQLGDVVYSEISDVTNESVRNKKSLADFIAALKLRVGSIVYIDKYDSKSIISPEQKNLTDVLLAAQLNENERLIVIGFELDQICYVVCDKSDFLTRKVNLPNGD